MTIASALPTMAVPRMAILSGSRTGIWRQRRRLDDRRETPQGGNYFSNLVSREFAFAAEMTLQFLQNVLGKNNLMKENAGAEEISTKPGVESEGGEEDVGIQNDFHEMPFRISSSVVGG